jgi:hypothetical protein
MWSVTDVRLGIAPDAAALVRGELDAIVERYASEPARKLREAGVMLRRVRDAWSHGHGASEQAPDRDGASTSVARHLEAARSQESGDLLVVSVIVASRGEVIALARDATRDDLQRAIEAVAYREPGDLGEVEVEWRMTRAAALHPLAAGVAGKVFCTFCGAPFPAELVSCPLCGGPAPGRGA